MRDPHRAPWLRRSKIAVVLAALFAIAGGLGSLAYRSRGDRDTLEKIPRVQVRRADLRVLLTAGGQVDSSKKTLIECELENVEARSEGSSLGLNGSSAILELMPEGTQVSKGEILCRLDASRYEELVRQQLIQVEEERFEKFQAQLDLEVAETALNEYQEGVRLQIEQDYKGQIALAEADLQRAADRIDWLGRMQAKGYASQAQVATETSTLMKAEFNLGELRGQHDHFLKFGDPVSVLTFESQIEGAKAKLAAETSSVRRQEERLANYQKQVDNCTIRAPHDGFLVYANEHDGDTRVEVGSTVYRKQDLFYLPDLDNMEVHTTLHESVVDRVRDGMRARVQVEALPGLILEGHVMSISSLPVPGNFWTAPDAKNFLARVKLDSIPRGLKPGMSASVQVEVGRRPDALVIPTEALAVEDGREFCYVFTAAGVLERRSVIVLSGEQDLLEVASGLAEGEEVVLEPARNGPGLAGAVDAIAELAPRTSTPTLDAATLPEGSAG